MNFKGIVALLCLFFLGSCSGLKILGVLVLPSRSHYFVGSALMQGLADAGHDVTLVSGITQKDPVNYEQIEISGALDLMKSLFTNFFEFGGKSKRGEMEHLQDVGILFTNYTLNEKNVKKLMSSGRTFDVVIVEIFNSEALIGLGRHFNAKAVVGMSTFGASLWTNNLVGNPSPLSFVPHPFLSYTHKMSFNERLQNTLLTGYEMLSMHYSYYPRQAKLFHETFPRIATPFDQVLRNDVGLMLLNTHFTLGYPRPYLPNVVEVGGLNIKREETHLPKDLQVLLDGATQGVIYFSMGSNIKCTDMHKDKRDGLIEAFRKRNELVLWKYDGESLPGKPDNVILRQWFPQDAVLAHKNVRVFITHGGLLSTTESIYFGKPIIGIPIFGDQQLNMKRAAQMGYGVVVEYKNVSETAMSWAIRTVLESNE